MISLKLEAQGVKSERCNIPQELFWYIVIPLYSILYKAIPSTIKNVS